MFPEPAKRVLSIALPAIGEAYLQNLLGVVDSIFIARIGLLAVDAVGVTNIYSMTYIGVFTAVSTASSVFLSRAIGAKNLERGRSVVWHGFLAAFILGLILSVVSILFSLPLLHIMGAYGKLQEAALPYFRTVLGISPLIALFTAQAATAASVTIGQAIGSRDVSAALSYRRWSYILSAAAMTLITAVICVLMPWIGRLFTHEETVIRLLVVVLAIDTISQPFLAATLVDTSAIQAGGDSKVTTIGIWGDSHPWRLPVCLAFGIRAACGLGQHRC